MAKSVDKKKRYDRATNELIVLEFINKYIKENGGYPPLEIIKKGVAQYMSARTVDRIISDVNIRDACKNHPSKLRLGEFLNSLCGQGIKGNVPAGKLWLALAFGWSEKKMVEVLTGLKDVDKYDYSSLSPDEIDTLTDLLSKAEKKTITPFTFIINPVTRDDIQ